MLPPCTPAQIPHLSVIGKPPAARRQTVLYSVRRCVLRQDKLTESFLWLPSLEGPVSDYNQGGAHPFIHGPWLRSRLSDVPVVVCYALQPELA